MDIARLRKYIHTLEDIKDQTSTPLITYAVFEKEVGYGNAKETIASLIKHSDWDGRISPRNIEWAKKKLELYGTPESVVEKAYTTIHLAHLDQIADYARRLDG